MEFARPHATLTANVRQHIDRILEEAQEETPQLVAHMQVGLQQIETYMDTQHRDADGCEWSSFDAMVAQNSDVWEQHVNKARNERDFGIRERIVQDSLQLPLSMKLFDLKVGRPGRPDDNVYQKSQYAREKMPRGNFVASYTSSQTQQTHYFPVVRAYRKFTGQEDDGEEKGKVNDEVLSKFFTKPMTETRTVITTTKENGEAGHLAVLKRSDGQYLFVIGSKNTHMMVLSLEDIAYARQAARARGHGNGGMDPYTAAAQIGAAILTMVHQLPDDKRKFLCEFLWQTRATASFEVLCPGHQHVQLLDYLDDRDTPVFYGLSLPVWTPMPGAEICVNPILAYVLMREYLGIRTVVFQVLPYDETFGTTLQSIKEVYQHEGSVNLFADGDHAVIGMAKYKTCWYVCLRAIREKAKSCLSLLVKEDNNNTKKKKTAEVTTPEEAVKVAKQQLRKRFASIKDYLDLTSTVCDAYCELGGHFVEYLCLECLPISESARDLRRRVADLFPVVWKEFLLHTERSDRIV